MIEPHGGEINYALANTNLDQFYSDVLTQDVTEHKVRNNSSGELVLTTRQTKRKIG